MGGYLISLIWGFAEATLFFFVPDIWISILALQGRRKGLIACLYAVAGAMVGGIIMYFLGQADVQSMNVLLNKIPAIRTMDIQKVQADLHSSGALAILLGSFIGIPYKIYAVNAHSVMPVFVFMLITIPARIARFFLVALVASYASEKLLSRFSPAGKVRIILGLWIAFYIVYFILKSV